MDKQKRMLEKKMRNKKNRDSKKHELKMQKIEQKQNKNIEAENLKRNNRALIMVLAYMYKSVYGKMPEEGESMDAIAIRDLCKKFINECSHVYKYQEIRPYAERKIKTINETLKKEKIVIKNLKKLSK